MNIWTQNRILRNQPGEPAGAVPSPDPDTPPSDPAEPEAPAIDPPAGAGAATQDNFDWMPEAYRADGSPDFARFRQDFDDAQAQIAALNENAPETPEAYDISLPDEIDYGEIQVPDWFEFNINQDDPAVGEFRNVLHKHRVPAAAAQEFMTALARSEAAKAARFQEQAQQEMQSLGPQSQARMQRVQRALETRVPNQEMRQALLSSLTTANAFRALETFVSGATQTAGQSAPASAQFDSIENPYARLQAIREAGQ